MIARLMIVSPGHANARIPNMTAAMPRTASHPHCPAKTLRPDAGVGEVEVFIAHMLRITNDCMRNRQAVFHTPLSGAPSEIHKTSRREKLEKA
jgi:hypothetical protein